MKPLKIIIFSILVLFFSNCARKNDFGIHRVPKIHFGIKNCVDDDVYNKVDTAAIYVSSYKSLDSTKLLYQGFKFYSKNRVGFFSHLPLNNNEFLNSKYAMMGYYSTCNNENKIQLGRYWVQAGVIINRKEFEIKADTLIVTNKDKSNGLYITGKFLKHHLSSEQLIYKPDW
jgi:hypothetical protein